MRRQPIFMILVLSLVLAGVALAQSGPKPQGSPKPQEGPEPQAGQEPQAGPFDLSWWTVDAGGGGSSGGRYGLTGAIGQPDAEALSGGRFRLAGGWLGGGVAVLHPVAYLPSVAAGQMEIVREEDLPPDQLTADDPILQTGRLDPTQLSLAPPAPPESRFKGAHALMEETAWTIGPNLTLAPNQSHELTVSFAEPSVLLAHSLWTGTLNGMEMVVLRNGATVVMGTPYAIPPDHGTLLVRTVFNTPGSATVRVTNRSAVPVAIKLVVGVLDLNAQDAGGGEEEEEE